jgi:hypothetical protein
MSYETYYPEQRHLLGLTTFRRDRLLPLDAGGTVEVSKGDRVDLHHVVARGSLPSAYVVIDAMRALRLRRPEQLADQVRVAVGDLVDTGQLLAGRDGRRRRKILSPLTGSVAYIGEGRIILQEIEETITVEAGLTGKVIEVRKGRGAVVEGTGAVVQGVWGNNRRAIGTLKLEPDDGLEHIYGEALSSPFRGTVVITRRPLRAASFAVIVDQDIAGVIAPSMEPGLIDEALACPRAILLTEGFGNIRMGGTLSTFLVNLQGRQATVDASQTGVLEARRPEAVITVPVVPGERPTAPRTEQTIQPDLQVRLTRGDFVGSVGTVTDLLDSPVLLDNGLSVYCARVRLITGEIVAVPLENLEVFG